MEAEFIELPAFTRALVEYGLSDEWLAQLQEDLILGRGVLYRPPGLGGLYKKRVSNPARGKGKRGGFRVYFAEYEDFGVIVLILLADKDVEERISTEEQRTLRRLAADLRKEVEAYVHQGSRERTGRSRPRGR